MTDGVRPVSGTPVTPIVGGDRREADRRTAERRAAAASKSRALVPAGEVVEHPADPAARATNPADTPLAPAAGFAAQMIGQGGQRNGIKGGPPVLDKARNTYLGAEYSGERERRPPAGTTKKTEI